MAEAFLKYLAAFKARRTLELLDSTFNGNMNKKLLIVTIPLMFSSAALAQQKPIDLEQNDNFSKVPAAVAKAIRLDKDGYYSEALFDACKTLVGQRISLSGGEKLDGYVVSTNGCGCGSAACPVWVVQDSVQPSVLLSGGAIQLSILKTGQKGLSDISLTAENAGNCNRELWRFDGLRYRSEKGSQCREESNNPPTGSYGFDWGKANGRCIPVTAKSRERFGKCTYKPDGGSFGLDYPFYSCKPSKRTEYLVYANKRQCVDALEMMEANGY